MRHFAIDLFPLEKLSRRMSRENALVGGTTKYTKHTKSCAVVDTGIFLLIIPFRVFGVFRGSHFFVWYYSNDVAMGATLRHVGPIRNSSM